MAYKRKVDKGLIPTCNIMGVNIAAINMEWLVDYLEKNISEIKGDYICVSNVHTTVTSFEDADYCAIQNGGLMAIPDGGPLSTVGQKRGHKNMERTTGPSLMGEIFEISAKKGYRHYFYGSKEETLELLYQKLTSNYPGIQIAGMYSPPFRPLTEEEDKAIIERINETKPDFVWVGLGAPKQEKWMAAHQGKIDSIYQGTPVIATNIDTFSFVEKYKLGILCPYASTDRVGDISLGDHWNVGQIDSSFWDRNGVSLAIVNAKSRNCSFIVITITSLFRALIKL